MIYCKLVKLGYGSLKEVKEMNATEVLMAINFETFINEYEQEYVELNSDNS